MHLGALKKAQYAYAPGEWTTPWGLTLADIQTPERPIVQGYAAWTTREARERCETLGKSGSYQNILSGAAPFSLRSVEGAHRGKSLHTLALRLSAHGIGRVSLRGGEQNGPISLYGDMVPVREPDCHVAMARSRFTSWDTTMAYMHTANPNRRVLVCFQIKADQAFSLAATGPVVRADLWRGPHPRMIERAAFLTLDEAIEYAAKEFLG